MPPQALDRIGQIAIPVSDVDRAIAFYRDTLGMRFLFRAPPGLGFFHLNGVRLMLDAPAKAQGAGCSVIYYKVPDINATWDALVRGGVKQESKPRMLVRMPDHELWLAFFRDPDENLLALMSEVRPPVP